MKKNAAALIYDLAISFNLNVLQKKKSLNTLLQALIVFKAVVPKSWLVIPKEEEEEGQQVFVSTLQFTIEASRGIVLHLAN